MHNFGKSSILIVKIMVLRWGLQEVVKAGYTFTEVERDNRIVIDTVKRQMDTLGGMHLVHFLMIRKPRDIRIFIDHLIRDIRILIELTAS